MRQIASKPNGPVAWGSCRSGISTPGSTCKQLSEKWSNANRLKDLNREKTRPRQKTLRDKR